MPRMLLKEYTWSQHEFSYKYIIGTRDAGAKDRASHSQVQDLKPYKYPNNIQFTLMVKAAVVIVT